VKKRTWAALAGTAAVAVGAACALGGCANLGYLWQSAGGHLDLLQAARPVAELIADPATPADLRQRLELSQRIRDFAVSELRLPDNDSYRRYADLGRPSVIWNVIAAPELSLTLKTWCFPVTGCIGYRGYFDQQEAEALGEQLRREGYDVSVYGVPAYSTLGKIPGRYFADPLLNTFIRYNDGELARMVFHELSHQVVFAQGDTTFNESFATAVERIGAKRWLERHADERVRRDYEAYDGRRNDFRELVLRHRAAFDELYRSERPEADKRAGKAELLARLRADYATLKAERWGGYAGYDGWFERVNNAVLGGFASYNQLTADFERLFDRSGGDFERFYAEVRRLAELPKDERERALRQP
jgi:predicted aminopeptidase